MIFFHFDMLDKVKKIFHIGDLSHRRYKIFFIRQKKKKVKISLKEEWLIACI